MSSICCRLTFADLRVVQGYAVRTGMMICRGQLVLMMDADGATRVSDVERLEAALERVAVKGQWMRPACTTASLQGLPWCVQLIVTGCVGVWALQSGRGQARGTPISCPHPDLVSSALLSELTGQASECENRQAAWPIQSESV